MPVYSVLLVTLPPTTSPRRLELLPQSAVTTMSVLLIRNSVSPLLFALLLLAVQFIQVLSDSLATRIPIVPHVIFAEIRLLSILTSLTSEERTLLGLSRCSPQILSITPRSLECAIALRPQLLELHLVLMILPSCVATVMLIANTTQQVVVGTVWQIICARIQMACVKALLVVTQSHANVRHPNQQHLILRHSFTILLALLALTTAEWGLLRRVHNLETLELVLAAPKTLPKAKMKQVILVTLVVTNCPKIPNV